MILALFSNMTPLFPESLLVSPPPLTYSVASAGVEGGEWGGTCSIDIEVPWMQLLGLFMPQVAVSCEIWMRKRGRSTELSA